MSFSEPLRVLPSAGTALNVVFQQELDRQVHVGNLGGAELSLVVLGDLLQELSRFIEVGHLFLPLKAEPRSMYLPILELLIPKMKPRPCLWLGPLHLDERA